MIDYNIILAKSSPKNPEDKIPVTLEQHIDDGLKILQSIKKAFPKINNLEVTKSFWDLLYLCVIFHDLGKAHVEFQKILRGSENNQWNSQRHELFSLPFLEGLEMNENEKQWLRLIIAGHHKDYNWLKSTIRANYHQIDPDMPILGDEMTYEEAFSSVNTKLVYELLASAYNININSIEINSPQKLISNYIRTPYNFSTKNYLTLLLMFGAFKHCDHLSSAFVEKLELLEQDNFSFLYNRSYSLYEHQKKAKNTLGNLILTAPTGSGKTETAMLWLENQLFKSGQGRTFYILPFTASINAMFERLGNPKNGLGINKVGMLHGKLSSYLYEYFNDFQYSNSERKEQIKELKYKFQTLETPLKILTPFQLLKHIFGLKGFEKGIFEFVGGYFIFDEIHAYNPSVFAQIIVLLEFITQHLGAKVMIMTATFPSFMKSILKKSIGNCIEIQASDKLYKNFVRHKVIVKDGLLSDNLDSIIQDLQEGKSVLIVCNTVKSAQNIYHSLAPSAKDSVLLHSSFCGRDRNILERKLKEETPQLLVGTQAIEVSLDIDYDTIYTEPAPLDALIQRFGRVNRKREKRVAKCHVFSDRNESDKYIYADELIHNTLKVLKEIEIKNNGIIKEKELQRYIDVVYPSFSEEEQKEYQLIHKLLTDSLADLSPFLRSKEKEEDFYKQFDGVKVVPYSLVEEYRKLLEEDFDFIKAESLKVQINQKRFNRFLNNNIITESTIAFSNPERENAKEIKLNYYQINREYLDLKSGSLGLLIDQATSNFL
jgi:CRISPR-associated endonuclease/helicase Cas3